MKKLLFTLVAAGACSVASAAVNFDGLTTFDPTVAESDGKYYWEINMSTDPELSVTDENDEALGYLQLNTGSTPLWRTFLGTDSQENATNATLDAGAYATNGVVVSSDVKLTACTEWPTLTDFANEKLALFLFAPEEGDTSGKTNGLYAVGGAMVDGNLTATAYRLNADPNTITNTDGWATIAIKSYADIMKESGDTKYPAFVIAVGPKDGTLTVVSADAKAGYAPGFLEEELTPAAVTRIANRTLIPSAKTSDGTLQGLGFQGEGGIDNVNLDADDFATDAVAFTVAGNGAGKATFDNDLKPDQNGVITVPASVASVSFTLNLAANEEATVTYKSGETAVGNLTNNGNIYTFAPVANATLTITVRTLLFQANGTDYATFADALTAALAADGKVTLLGAVDLGAEVIQLTAGTVVIDLNGKELSGSGNADTGLLAVIVNLGANLTIKDSGGTGSVVPNGEGVKAVWQQMGTLLIEGGAFDGAITTETVYGATTTITGGKFVEKVAGATLVGGDWTQEGGYWTIGAATPAPSIDAEDGTIDEDKDGDYVVTPNENVTEVNITVGDYTGNVIVPSTVTKITGTIAPAQIGVQLGAYKVIGAFKLNADTNMIELNKDATVKVGSEDINVEPELATVDADGETAVEPFVAGDKPAATVKTIPGLKYSLIWDADVGGSFSNVAVAPTQATSSRMKLEDATATDVTKRFYKVKVTK